MKILIIGGGGREHALAWRLARESHVILASPGNPGIARLGEIIASTNFVDVAERVRPDLTVVGPEAPLAAGIVDTFRSRDLAIVGPTQEMARLESSKIHAKKMMLRLGIPTARFFQAASPAEAMEAITQFNFPVVVKADGLAAGKGVVIAHHRQEAESAIRALGSPLILEEFLEGEEVSFIVISDGRNLVPLEPTQDHKTLQDDGRGPNTGGMGAYCDGRILSPADSQRIVETILEPVIHATAFTGFLYAGIMMTATGPKVLEFNARLGDPETQPLMQRLDQQSSLADVLMRSATGTLAGASLRFRADPSVCVVLAAAGYPGNVQTGDPIGGIEDCHADVFQAGTRLGAAGLETAGGRVLGVTASGSDLRTALANAYASVSKIRFNGMQYRRDIGRKGLKRWPIANSKADTIGNEHDDLRGRSSDG